MPIFSILLLLLLITKTITVILAHNNNNIQDNVYGAVIMAEPLQEFTRFI